MMHLWGERNIKQSIDLPRLHHQLLPMKIMNYPGKFMTMLTTSACFYFIISFPGFDINILKYLSSIGHEITQLSNRTLGSVVQGIAVDDTGIITANNDWRKSGAVDGY